MSFTEKKFASLSRLNKLKKTIVVVKQYLEDKKALPYVLDVLGWLKKAEHVHIPGIEWESLAGMSDYQWGMLLEHLRVLIGDVCSFSQERPYDGTALERQVLPLKIILDNIRSPFNVGSIIRSAEAFGVEEVILAGITPSPASNSKVQRSAMAAPVFVRETSSCPAQLALLKEQGYYITALEKTRHSVPLTPLENAPQALVVGNEEFGISEAVLALCHRICHIPLWGAKNSLNVSVAAGIALYEVTKGFFSQ